MNRWVRAGVVGGVAGVVGTAVKSRSEPALQSLFEAWKPPAPGEKDLVGADPAGRPDNMPPAAGIRRVGEALTGSEPPEKVVAAGSQAVHFSFGTAGGILYSLLVEAFPPASLGGGVVAALGLYGGTHASTLPLIGLQPPPTSMPRAAVLWEATSHAVYGLTVDVVRRLGLAALSG